MPKIFYMDIRFFKSNCKTSMEITKQTFCHPSMSILLLTLDSWKVFLFSLNIYSNVGIFVLRFNFFKTLKVPRFIFLYSIKSLIFGEINQTLVEPNNTTNNSVILFFKTCCPGDAGPGNKSGSCQT